MCLYGFICKILRKRGKKTNFQTYRNVWERDPGCDEEPLGPVRPEADRGGEEEHHRQRQVEEGDSGGPAEDFSEIGGGGEVVELDLRDAHHGLELRRVGGEVEVGAGERLDPQRRHQDHPFPRLPRHCRSIRRRSPFDWLLIFGEIFFIFRGGFGNFSVRGALNSEEVVMVAVRCGVPAVQVSAVF